MRSVRKRYVLLGALTVLVGYFGAFCWTFASDPYAGAAVMSAVPWASGTSNPGGTVNGECNEEYLAHNNGATAKAGFSIQLACQAEVPAVGASLLGASVLSPCSGEQFDGGTSWTNTAYSGSGSWCFVNNVGSVSGQTCTASTSGPGPAVYFLNTGPPQYGCSTSGAQCSLGIGYPELPCQSLGDPGVVDSHGTRAGSATYFSATQVLSYSLGPSETVGGKAWQAMSFVELVEVPFGSVCSGCGGTAPLNSGVPVNVAGGGDSSSSTVPDDCSGFDPTSDTKYQGNALSGYDEPTLVFANGSAMSTYTGWDGFVKLDKVSCGVGAGNTVKVAMPPTFFQGGTAGGSSSNTNCNLVKVTGPTATQTLQSGKSYSFTFTYTGGADTIIVDSNDGSSPSQAIPGVSPTAYVAADAGMNDPTGSPDTVSITPTTNVIDPVFYCVFAGVLYEWGDAYGANPVGSGTGTGGFLPCTSGSPCQTSLDQCFASAGWSLTDPVSWVTGGLHDGLCILEYLFIPSSGVITSFTDLFSVSSSMSSAQPATAGQWLGTLTSFIGTWPASAVDSIKSSEEGSGCSAGPTVSIDGATTSICSQLAAASGTASWTTIDAVVTAVFAVMLGLALFALVRRVVSGNSA